MFVSLQRGSISYTSRKVALGPRQRSYPDMVSPFNPCNSYFSTDPKGPVAARSSSAHRISNSEITYMMGCALVAVTRGIGDHVISNPRTIILATVRHSTLVNCVSTSELKNILCTHHELRDYYRSLCSSLRVS